MNSECSKEMNYQQFVQALPKLFAERYKDQIEKLNMRILEIKKIYRDKKKKFAASLAENEDILLDLYEELKGIDDNSARTNKEETKDGPGNNSSANNQETGQQNLENKQEKSINTNPGPSKEDINIQASDDTPINPKIKSPRKNIPPYHPPSSLSRNPKLSPQPKKTINKDLEILQSDSQPPDPPLDQAEHPSESIMTKHKAKIKYIVATKFNKDNENPEVTILKKEKERILQEIEETSGKLKDRRLLQEEANDCVERNYEQWKDMAAESIALPFNTKVKDLGELAKPGKKYRFKPNVSMDEIKEQVAQIKRRRERQKLKQVFEAKQRYEKGRKFIKKEHERLIKKKHAMENIYQDNISPYEDEQADSPRDHLYLIIPKNPKKFDQNKSVQNYSRERNLIRKSSIISVENNSSESIRNNLYNQKQRGFDRPIRMQDLSQSVSKPRERSKRLYNRKNEIYLPNISKNPSPNRGRSLIHTHDASVPNIRNIPSLGNKKPSIENYRKINSKLGKEGASRKLRNPLKPHRNQQVDLSIH
ncbi:unnamed protein product [Moneuplotes crassus]|uniref:Uncharacterized protein n=1 Tax=Euplotes crassus TaxID=5936 RepID=A0AAD1Y4N1_EUPCR|nr:unnamed protein product [Moneuplotes crassus]